MTCNWSEPVEISVLASPEYGLASVYSRFPFPKRKVIPFALLKVLPLKAISMGSFSKLFLTSFNSLSFSNRTHSKGPGPFPSFS